ncbi:HD domain-containing phosphohydrolase [Ferrimonas senticii]|uniref:HD domain-containing phosphohydrolase n=1 Tax=Ferrimonas senticii TaxID=394566 RepID=UPI0004078AAC|nr:HD domain-containing phosphohydrolase [Ferrimonas senticii]
MTESANAPATILLVDDCPENLHLLGGILAPQFKVLVARSSEEAIARLPQKPDLILLDIVMPNIDGYQFCRWLKTDISYGDIPVIFISAASQPEDEAMGFESGAVDFIRKPFYAPTVLHRVRTHLAAHSHKMGLMRALEHEESELHRSRLVMLEKLAQATAFKDEETGLHVLRVAHYAKLIAEAHGCDSDWCKDLFHAAPLHDIGKIGIPDAILSKPSALDDAEWQLMKRHTEIGAQLLEGDQSSVMVMSRTIALYHHERFDGNGYPHGLAGHNIPLEARIVAIADVFDALISERAYKKAMSCEQAIEIIAAGAGSQFDPELVAHFLAQQQAMIATSQTYRD